MNSCFPVLLCFLILWSAPENIAAQWFLPIGAKSRTDIAKLKLSSIGQFGLERKARKSVPAHLHTGIDILRPNNDYVNEKVFPACNGVVISIRDDGPYAQVIIEHRITNGIFWTVYEHVAGISCHVGDSVFSGGSIARFFNRAELDSFGWQFDHFHFEIMKVRPVEIIPSRNLPERHLNTYALTCYTNGELLDKYYDPVGFFYQQFKK